MHEGAIGVDLNGIRNDVARSCCSVHSTVRPGAADDMQLDLVRDEKVILKSGGCRRGHILI